MAPTKILFFPLSERGQLNVVLAVVSALLSRPDLELHIACFSDAAPRIDELRQQTASTISSGTFLTFHELPALGMAPAALRNIERTDILHGLGLKEVKRVSNVFMSILSPWTKEEYGAIFQKCFDLVGEVDPDLVVVDGIFAPAQDALKVSKPPRRQVYLLPNSLKDSLGAASKFWQYPSLGTGYGYPLAWHEVPRNFYFLLQVALVLPRSHSFKESTAVRTSLGLTGPWPTFARDPTIPTICMSTPESEFPLAIPPATVPLLCGPILLDVRPVDQVDPELAAWLKARPTVLICLGSHIAMDDEYAKEMIGGLRLFFDQRTDVQVLWKLNRQGMSDHLEESVIEPVKAEVDDGRLKMVTWLAPDPLAILQTGKVVCSVSHGGSNSYHEAVWTGVPQIVLPAWFDCYDFAARAEYLGIGVWANRASAPRVSASDFGKALLTVVGGGEEGSQSRLKAEGYSRKAAELGEKVRPYGGREKAAKLLLDMAKQGI